MYLVIVLTRSPSMHTIFFASASSESSSNKIKLLSEMIDFKFFISLKFGE